ncbi:DUF4437 domain-containing protein [Pontibacter sp. G13]|uniref:DUF4437 domain-containing protein n=1 Tax=Pontibacter sp. G13 TaxID=3074898 RepID=UPI00288C2301|nr:DUF4437 domain-containing protein [Pontibacter sp. G13]WNJ17864.1 DUF4437 domain-containing protein [Pontibacter sp. G13]
MNRFSSSMILLAIVLSSCNPPSSQPSKESLPHIERPTNEVILSSEIVWEPLNPARGDKSPQAGTIWGDRKGTVATGFLAKFVDGFSSPPHIHNVTYRAVVLRGLVHNDDADAEEMWMPSGSFWTQPLGQPHITSAKGAENIAYVEIDSGPYLVKPVDESFDNGERPVNIDASNVVWLDHSETNWVAANGSAEISFLWDSQGNDHFRGLFVKIPAGFDGIMETQGEVFRSIIIQGNLNYEMPVDHEIKMLDAGSSFSSTGLALHHLTNPSEESALIYVRTDGELEVQDL